MVETVCELKESWQCESMLCCTACVYMLLCQAEGAMRLFKAPSDVLHMQPLHARAGMKHLLYTPCLLHNLFPKFVAHIQPQAAAHR